MDLPEPGIEPGSPELQAVSLPTELSWACRGEKIQEIFRRKTGKNVVTEGYG